MKRAGYRDAVDFIAQNDSPGDGDDADTIASYTTVVLVAAIFGAEPHRVARDVARRRKSLES